MSTTHFPPGAYDEQLVAHGQPTRQQMYDEMVGAGAELECYEMELGSVSSAMHYVTMRYAGSEIRYGAVGDFPVARAYQDFRAIRELLEDGATMLCDRTSGQAFRVRVQVKNGRQYHYNDHTTSTSGYPVRRAVEKYRAWKAKRP